VKVHKYSHKLEEYCYRKYCKAVSRDAQLWWMNRHMEMGDLAIKAKEVK